MKSSVKTCFLIAAAVVVALGYWYITRSAAGPQQRTLITDNAIEIGEVHVAGTSITKREAYEERLKESAALDARLTYAAENQRPQKLVESVTRAMMSPYERKLEQLKAERTTVPVYDGKPFSMPPDQEEAVQVNHRDRNVAKRKPAARARRDDKDNDRNHRALHSPAEMESVFNTTSFETPAPRTPGMEHNRHTITIKACVFGEQMAKPGGTIRFRLLESVRIDGITYNRNTVFHGHCSFGPDRLLVVVDRMPVASGGYSAVNLTLHDPGDFQEGIYAPTARASEEIVDASSGSVEQIIGNVNSPGGLSIGSSVARIFRTVVNGTPAVPVPDGHPVIFLTPTP